MRNQPYIVGIAGRSCSGKSTLAQELAEILGENAIHIDIDKIFWSLAEFNCASPSEKEDDALQELYQELIKLKEGKTVNFFIFDCHHQRKSTKNPISYHSAKIIIVEGTLLLWSEIIRKVFDLKVLVDVPNEVCLQRRLERHLNRLSDTDTEYERDKIKKQILARWELISEQWDRYLDSEARMHADVIISHPGKGTKRLLLSIENFLNSANV